IIFASIQRTFSPPDSTLAFFSASSPENSIRPRKPRRKVSSWSCEYSRSHSTRLRLTPSKYLELSLGKYACEVVTPQLYSPASASSSPITIWKKVVFARPFGPTKAILSPLLTTKLTLSSTFSLSTVLVKPSTLRSCLPASRSDLKCRNGYFRFEGRISSSVILSSCFFRDVACFDFEAFAENR